MNLRWPELPKGSWKRVIIYAFAITAFVAAAAMTGSYYGALWFNGNVTTADILVALVLSSTLTPPITILMLIKMQQLRLANEKLRIYATTDGLTGTLSRLAFTTQVENHLNAHADAVPVNGESAGSLLILDVDKFKRINDSFGHQQGDIALRLIASAIRANARSFDRVGRLGGEEFGVFLVDAASEYAAVVSERIRDAITRIEFAPEVAPLPLSISIGVATARHGHRFAELYHAADMNLYKAKSQGRNKVVMEDWLEEEVPPKPVPAPVSSVA